MSLGHLGMRNHLGLVKQGKTVSKECTQYVAREETPVPENEMADNDEDAYILTRTRTTNATRAPQGDGIRGHKYCHEILGRGPTQYLLRRSHGGQKDHRPGDG